jgi:hypothetical protein
MQACMMPSEHGTLVVQSAHQHLHAAIQFAQDVLLRDFAITEHQFASVGAAHSKFVELLRGGETLAALLDDESGYALRARIYVGLGIHHQNVRVRSVGDPHLVAVEDIAVALPFGAQFHAHHVGTGIRLAHRQRADVFAGYQPGQILALLCLIAVAADLVHRQVRVCAIGKPDGAGSARDLFHRHNVREIAHMGTAVFLLDGDAEQPEAAELAP